MQKRTKKNIIIVIKTVLIVALFIYFCIIIEKDYDKFAETFSRITIPFLFGLLAFQLGIHGLGSVQWLILLRQAGSKKGLFSIFLARLTGFAISYLTPSLYLGGEPVRAAILNDKSLTYKKTLASVVLDKYIELFTKVPCIITGFALLIVLIKPDLLFILPSALFIVFFVSLFIFLLIKLFKDKSFINNFFKFLLKPLIKVRPRTAVKVMKVIKEFQYDLTTIIKQKKAFYLASLIGFVVSIIQVFQTYYIFSFLFPVEYTPLMLLIYSFIIFFSSLIFSLIPFPTPGGLGPVEGVFVAFFILFGMKEHKGLLYSAIIRIGQFVSIGIGLINLTVKMFINKSDKNVKK